MKDQTSFPIRFAFLNQLFNADVLQQQRKKQSVRYDIHFHRARCTFEQEGSNWTVSSNFDLCDQLKSAIIRQLQMHQQLN